MQLIEQKKDVLPDFALLRHRFERLGNGPRAELRRVANLDQVADVPAFYRWLATAGLQPSGALQRVAFLMPFATHSPEAKSLGRQLFLHKVGEMRLFQMLRAEPPRDLEHLRRLLRFLDEPGLDWHRFGRTLYYWGPNVKRSILQDYFMTEALKKEANDG